MSRCPACGSQLRTWSKPLIVHAIQAWHEEHGRPPTSTEWRHATPHTPSCATVYTMFGSWAAAIEDAGFSVYRSRRRWTREEVVQAIYQHRYRTGSTPKLDDWKRRGDGTHPSASAVVRLFGTWSNAISAAGYDPPRKPRRKRDADGTYVASRWRSEA